MQRRVPKSFGYEHTEDGLLKWEDPIDLKEYFRNMDIEYDQEKEKMNRQRPSGNPFESNGVYHLEFKETSNMFGEDETTYRLVADTDFDIKNPDTGKILRVHAGDRGGFMTPDSIIETKDGVPAGWVFDEAKLVGSTIKFSDSFPEDADADSFIPNTMLKGHACAVDSHIEAGWVDEETDHDSVFIGEDSLLVNSEISNSDFKGAVTVYGANTYGYTMKNWSADLRRDGVPSAKNQCSFIEFTDDSILYDNSGKIVLSPNQGAILDGTFITETNLDELFSDVEKKSIYSPVFVNMAGASIQAGKILSGREETGEQMHRHVFDSPDGPDLARQLEDWLIPAIGLRFVQLQPELELTRENQFEEFTPERTARKKQAEKIAAGIHVTSDRNDGDELEM